MMADNTLYWIGQPLALLPKRIFSVLHERFTFIECGDDVSVLSNPKVRLCFFFYNQDINRELLNSAINLCENLNRKLVIVHHGECKITNSDFILEKIKTNQSNYNLELDKIQSYLIHDFDKVKARLNAHNQTLNNRVSDDLVKAIQYIEQHIANPIQEKDIAEHCHYSVTYFSKIFHKHTGKSFIDYLTFKRIANAKRLLISEPNCKIEYIAYQCGYKDVSYFSRMFKKKTGVSPGVFRQTNSFH
ncbi:helix-turn-helix domain-containing protein [Vibrio aestuarianus]|uniref:AraC family transcriptional regulator n=1 Tax=Vibrio aestuarianus TaxID=28171 RepID=A0ABD7YIX8_9VIBR|nr:AraC family transcriptional regulator [Vibrio aestuarianus]WGK84811.1 AraC family transcriptional regulator [Vibrio aestuarianus]CAH8214698.1 Transcriptional regulator AraC family [Vibrio aestuarianus]